MVASLFCQTLRITLKHQWHAALHASGHMLEMKPLGTNNIGASALPNEHGSQVFGN